MSWDATDILEHMLGYATELSIVDHARGMAGYAAADLYSVRSPRLPLAPEVQDLGDSRHIPVDRRKAVSPASPARIAPCPAGAQEADS